MIPGADNSIIVRLKLANHTGMLSKVANAIAEMDCNIGAIDIIRVEEKSILRDVTIYTNGPESTTALLAKLESLDGVEVVHTSDRTFLMHIGGKIQIKSKVAITNRDELSMAYTPGVARVCMAIHDAPEKVYKLTIKRNSVAVVTDGSAVLGLGDIGPEASLPVMEGKAMLFKDFANIDAFPIALDTQDVDEIIKSVKNIAPVFGGINLEDISAPRCFEIEKRLKEELNIPVFHDDQHGTAIVLAAAFINALKIVKKKPEDIKVIVNGIGAAGVACTKILLNMGVKNIVGCDREGALATCCRDLAPAKLEYAKLTNPNNETGSLSDVIKGADVFIGVSAPKVLSVEALKTMNKDAIVFAMANPTPEIMPEDAYPHVAIMATGRSDYPNQINNVLAFPGVFRGALDCQATDINEAMKVAAAHAIASVIPDEALSPDYIVPSVFDTTVVDAVAEAVVAAAKESGVAQR